MNRWLSGFVLALIAVPLLGQEEGPATTPKGGSIDTTGKGYTAAYVIEPTTRRVLFAENEHVPLPTASMAKMMTLLIAMEEIRDGRLQWDTPITISPKASQMGGSQVYLRAGSLWPVKNLVIATMVHSANDAAQALAEKIAGSTEAFADLMNQRAEELKLTHSTFYDPHGLPNFEDPSRVDTMCAYDLAVLGIELYKYPFMRQLGMVPEMPFQNATLARIYNPNRLINPRAGEHMGDATGIKTGFTAQAGYCITASARRNNMDLVAVVMGATTSRGPRSSFGIAARLMNEAFIQYRMLISVKRGAVVGEAAVNDGAEKTVQAVAPTDAGALVKRGEDRNVKVSFQANAVTAPVKKGQPVGTIVVMSGTQTLSKVPAVAAKDVPKAPWWKAFWPF